MPVPDAVNAAGEAGTVGVAGATEARRVAGSSARIRFDDLVACGACDLLHRRTALVDGETAVCARCSHAIQSARADTVERSLAATLAGLVLLYLAVTEPFMALSRAGIASRISVVDATLALWDSDFRWLGLLTVALIVLIPIVRLALLGAVLLPLWLAGGPGKPRPTTDRVLPRRLFRWTVLLAPWAMADIFMVGVVISLVKIGTVARLEVGMAFWALLATVAVMVYLDRSLCHETVWARLTPRGNTAAPTGALA